MLLTIRSDHLLGQIRWSGSGRVKIEGTLVFFLQDVIVLGFFSGFGSKILAELAHTLIGSSRVGGFRVVWSGSSGRAAIIRMAIKSKDRNQQGHYTLDD